MIKKVATEAQTTVVDNHRRQETSVDFLQMNERDNQISDILIPSLKTRGASSPFTSSSENIEAAGEQPEGDSLPEPLNPDDIYERMGIKVELQDFVKVHSFGVLKNKERESQGHVILEIIHPMIQKEYKAKSLPELCSCLKLNIYTLIFTKDHLRYCFFIDLYGKSFESRVRYVMMPSNIEIIDIAVEDDFSKMRFYNSDGLSRWYATKMDLKMKLRANAFEDYRKFTEYTFDWKKLIKQGKKNKSFLDEIYQKKLLTCGEYTKYGISIKRNSLIQVIFTEEQVPKLVENFKLQKQQLYDEIDIVRLLNGEHLVLARFNDYRDMIVFIEERVENKIVFDSRIKQDSNVLFLDKTNYNLDSKPKNAKSIIEMDCQQKYRNMIATPTIICFKNSFLKDNNIIIQIDSQSEKIFTLQQYDEDYKFQWDFILENNAMNLFQQRKFTIQETFLLDHAQIRLLFDSVLITLDVYHDTNTGRAATEVRKVDRFDYELIEVLNWDTYYASMDMSPIAQPIVQMIGVSKLFQMPIYDWDYVQRYGDNIIKDESNLPKEHYLISFNEFKVEKESDDDQDYVQIKACSFKGKIIGLKTLNFKLDEIFSTFIVKDIETQRTKLYSNHVQGKINEIKEFDKPIQEGYDQEFVKEIVVYREGEVFIGQLNRFDQKIEVFSSCKNEIDLIYNKDIFEQIEKLNDPRIYIDPSGDFIFSCDEKVYLYNREDHASLNKLIEINVIPGIETYNIHIIDDKYFYNLYQGKLTITNLSNMTSKPYCKQRQSHQVRTNWDFYIDFINIFYQQKRFGMYCERANFISIVPYLHSASIPLLGFKQNRFLFGQHSFFGKIEDDKTITGVITQEQCVKWDKFTLLPYKSHFQFNTYSLYPDIRTRKVGENTFSEYKFSNAQDFAAILYSSENKQTKKNKYKLFEMPKNQLRQDMGNEILSFQLDEIDSTKYNENQFYFSSDLSKILILESQKITQKAWYESPISSAKIIDLKDQTLTNEIKNLTPLCYFIGLNFVSPNFLYNIKLVHAKEELDDGIAAEVRLYSINGDQKDFIILSQLFHDPNNLWNTYYQHIDFLFVTDYLLLDLKYNKNGYLIAYELIDFSSKSFRSHIIQTNPLVQSQYQDLLDLKAFKDIYIREQIMRKVMSSKADEIERELLKIQSKQSWFKSQIEFDGIHYNRDNEFMVRQLSFTFYDWLLAKQMIEANENFQWMSQNEAQQLLLNVFPDEIFTKQTFLHLISDEKYIKQSFNQQSLKTVLSKSMFVGSYKKQSPYLYLRRIRRDSNTFDMCPVQMMLKQNNLPGAALILENLKFHPASFHSEEIQEVIPDLFERPWITNNEALIQYLESRIQLPTECIKFQPEQSNLIIDEKNFEAYQNRSYQLINLKEHPTNCVSIKKIYPDQLDETFKNDIKIKFEILDVSISNQNQPEFQIRFFKSLSSVQDYEKLFNLKSIQAFIDYRFLVMKIHIIRHLLIPFILQLSLFIVYSNVFNIQTSESDLTTNDYYEKGFYVISIFLLILCGYFLLHEFAQIFRNGKDYFTKSVLWNLIDLLPQAMIIAVVIVKMKVRYEKFEPHSFILTIHSIASLMMWIKTFYFLRLFETTSYLIRMIFGSLSDMRVFLLILFIVELGFGEAFLRLSEASTGEGNYLDNYATAYLFTLRINLGDVSTDNLDSTSQPVLAWILFSLFAIFTNIVMLNLLISIIGQSFERIYSSSGIANLKERADLISENSYLLCAPFSWFYLHNDTSFLMIANDVTQEESQSSTTADVIAQEFCLLKINQEKLLDQLAQNHEENRKITSITDEKITKIRLQIEEKISDITKMTSNTDEKITELALQLQERSSKKPSKSDEQLTLMTIQIDEKIIKMTSDADEKLTKMTQQMDKKLSKMTSNIDEKLTQMNMQMDEKMNEMKSQIQEIVMLLRPNSPHSSSSSKSK